MTQVGGMTTIGRATSDIRKGRRVILREIQSNDFGWLYAISTASATGFRWRYRGTTPRPEEFVKRTPFVRVPGRYVYMLSLPPIPVTIYHLFQ